MVSTSVKESLTFHWFKHFFPFTGQVSIWLVLRIELFKVKGAFSEEEKGKIALKNNSQEVLAEWDKISLEVSEEMSR